MTDEVKAKDIKSEEIKSADALLGAQPVLLGAPPVLLSLAQFLRPYGKQISVFLLALVFTAGVTLSVGQGLKLVIDQGFAQQSQDHLNTAIIFI